MPQRVRFRLPRSARQHEALLRLGMRSSAAAFVEITRAGAGLTVHDFVRELFS